MTTKQKCEKLAKVLETVVSKLREDIGKEVWERDEPTMQALVAQVHLFLKKAIDVSSERNVKTVKKSKRSKSADAEAEDDKIMNDWPDILL